MRYQELLTEAKTGYLYHWIDIRQLPEIYEENKLSAKWKHLLPYTDEIVEGRSFSRNPRFIFNQAERILLVFNYEKLANNNKIVPLDADRVFYYGYDRLDFDKAYASGEIEFTPKNKDILKKGTRQLNTDFDEEFVIGDIKNISKKLEYAVQTIKVSKFQPRGQILEDFRIWCMLHDIRYHNLSQKSEIMKKGPMGLSDFHKQKRKK